MLELFNDKTEFTFRHNPRAISKSTDSVFVCKNNNIFLLNNKLPTVQDMESFISNTDAKSLLCFGTIDNVQCFLYQNISQEIYSKLESRDLRSSHTLLSNSDFQAGILANHLWHWLTNHNYCGKCGSVNQLFDKEFALKCTSCSNLFYPVIAPCVIVLIYDNDKILLAKAKNFTQDMYACVAGFVDPGENLEAAIKREVFEEVGLEVTNIQYVISQHWPFPNSLMMGFTAKYVSGELKVDETELVDAKWFSISEVRKMPNLPPKISISRFLIDQTFLSQESGTFLRGK